MLRCWHIDAEHLWAAASIGVDGEMIKNELGGVAMHREAACPQLEFQGEISPGGMDS